MSLLMDALKKADMAQKSSASPQQDKKDGDIADIQSAAPVAGGDTLKQEASIPPVETEPSTQNTAETTDVLEWTGSETPLPEPDSASKSDNIPMEPADTEKSTPDSFAWTDAIIDEEADEPPATGKETDAELQIMEEETDRGSDDKQNADNEQGEPSSPFPEKAGNRSAPVVKETVTARPFGQESAPQAEDARRILEAGDDMQDDDSNTTSKRWLLLMVIVALILAAAGGAWFYLAQLGSSDISKVPMPTRPAAMDKLRQLSAPPLVPASAAPQDDKTATISRPVPAQADKPKQALPVTGEGATNKEAALEEAPSLPPVAPTPITQQKMQPTEIQAASPSPVFTRKSGMPPLESYSDAPQEREAASQPEALREGAGLHIQRRSPTERMEADLNRAYQAYQNGDLSNATRFYGAVLREDKYNRNALLGMAGLALRQGDSEQAGKLYRQVLRLYPEDMTAETALLNLSPEYSGSEAESRIKLLLKDEPRNAYLYFTLANIYSRKQRWLDAQQAYFNAFRYDNNEPNYAYNLAVALEHLGKPAEALEFYRKAGQLAQQRPANFSIQSVEQRIKALSTGKE